MPRSRRKSAADEVAAIAARLDRLRSRPDSTRSGGWVPSGEFAADVADGDPPPASGPPASGSVRNAHFDPGRRGLVVLAVAALVAALGGAWYFAAAKPSAGALASAPSTTPVAQPASDAAPFPSGWPTPAASSAEPLVVDVVGRVAAPGVVELSPGARIRDAIAAAGGALPGTDLTALDLASKLVDGVQLFVGIPLPTGAAAQAGGGVVGGEAAPDGGDPSSGVVNINTATLAQLQTLPGVGPVLAQHIADWRTAHGRFASVSQLQQVSGIGPSKYAALAGRVKV